AARAGYGCMQPSIDDDSVDVEVGATGLIHATSVLHTPKLQLQLKATAQQIVLKDTHVAFPLPIKNYNDLRKRTMIPRLLVVLLLPPTLEEWLHQTEERMVSTKCAYWLSLLGQPDVANEATITVHIPRQNAFTVDNLRDLMERA